VSGPWCRKWESSTKRGLFELADQAFGGIRSEGVYSSP
jgi:hypothetical protein